MHSEVHSERAVIRLVQGDSLAFTRAKT